eukprot:8133252-Pyramimonas_sp.AAC.1
MQVATTSGSSGILRPFTPVFAGHSVAVSPQPTKARRCGGSQLWSLQRSTAHTVTRRSHATPRRRFASRP